MPAVIDHAQGKPPGYEGSPRNGELIPADIMLPNGQRISAPIKPRGMWAEQPRPEYVFKGLNQFFLDAARRAGFGDTSEEASLLAKAPSDWFFKQAAQSISNASLQTDPAIAQPSIDRARKLGAVMRFIGEAIEHAIADREPKPEPSPIVTPEDLTQEPESLEYTIDTPLHVPPERQPEITHDEPSSRHIRPRKSGKLGGDVHRPQE